MRIQLIRRLSSVNERAYWSLRMISCRNLADHAENDGDCANASAVHWALWSGRLVVGIGVHQQKLARFRQAENERGDAEAQIGEDEIVGVPGRLPKPLGANSRV